MTFFPPISAACFQPARSADRAAAQAGRMRRGFTLIELMVVFVIITILAGLSLAGLAGSRQRAKIDKTRTTIRKINEAIGPMYESYLRRRVPFTATASRRTSATNRLVALRTQMMYEMPDSLNDIAPSAPPIPTTPILAYISSKPFGPSSAECLFMILARSGIQPEIMEQFHASEIGDTNKNGLSEFIDGWGNPISFIRWAPGFSSLSQVQPADSTNFHDPMDAQRADTVGYALIPLIVSAGPDGDLGLTLSSGWSSPSLASLVTSGSAIGQSTSAASLDNVTNHDLVTK